MQNRLLGDENIRPRYVTDAKKLIGKRVEFLLSNDMDRSGRGYYFPHSGIITDAIGRNIEIAGDWIGLASIKEMRILP